MATSLSARLIISMVANYVLGSPVDGGVNPCAVRNAGERGRRWTDGTGSGEVDTPYIRSRSALGAGATDSYNVLAAGALKTPSQATIDLDEFKALIVRVTSGEIKVVGGAADPLSCFTGAGEGVKLVAGSSQQTFALDLGPGGVDSSTNGTFEVTETGGLTTADYEVEFIGAS